MVFFGRHLLLAGFQQQNFALPVLSRGEKVVFSAELRHICISRTIKEIVEKFGVSIDLDREKGEVKIAGSQNEQIKAAKDYIINITSSQKGTKKGPKDKDISGFELGQEFQGIVKKIAPFGAFVELKNGVDGLLHSSKSKHLNLSENQSLKVKISEIKNGKISVDLCE